MRPMLTKRDFKNALNPPEEQGGFIIGDTSISTVEVAYKVLARHRNDCRCNLCKKAVRVVLRDKPNQ